MRKRKYRDMFREFFSRAMLNLILSFRPKHNNKAGEDFILQAYFVVFNIPTQL